MKNRYFPFKKTLCLLSAVVLAFVAGCATAPPQKVEEKVFFPPPPELPRIQYLTYFTSEKDLSPEQSSFDKFVVGEKKHLRLDKPYGVAVFNGKIYVCDTNATVMVLDLEKKTITPLQGAQGLGKLVQPLNISIEKDGTKYVTDPIRGQIVVFDKNDFYINAIGVPGTWKPVDAVPYEDLLFVADIKNAVIKVFDKKTGAFKKEFGKKGKPEETLGLPTNLAIDKDGYIYVTDAGRFQVVKFDRDGHMLGAFGKAGANPAHFARPKGVATDRDGRFYVVDAAFNNVQIFNKEGQLLIYFGKGGIKAGDLYLPAKVYVDYDNVRFFQKYADPNFEVEAVIFVTNQFERRLVTVFALGKERGRKYPEDEALSTQVRERLLKMMKESPETKEEAEKPKEEGEKGK